MSVSTPDEATAADLEAVAAIARDYIEGWYSGNVARMDRALHADLVKRIQEDRASGGLRQVTKARMLELTADGGGGDPDASFEVFVDDVSTDIAAARVVSPEYVDYLQLVRTAAGWKIANVLFRNRD
jgi:hypothetical protein